MSASVSRPAIAARTTSSCPGRRGVEAEEVAQRCEEIAQAGEYRKGLGRLSADFATTSRPASLGARELVVAREPVVGHDVPVAGLVGVPVARDAKPRRSVERADCDRHILGVGRLEEEARSALAAEATPKVAIAVRTFDPAKRISVDDDVLRLGGREGAEVSTPAPALDAVADGDVAHRSAHPVGDRAAQAASCRARSEFSTVAS